MLALGRRWVVGIVALAGVTVVGALIVHGREPGLDVTLRYNGDLHQSGPTVLLPTGNYRADAVPHGCPSDSLEFVLVPPLSDPAQARDQVYVTGGPNMVGTAHLIGITDGHYLTNFHVTQERTFMLGGVSDLMMDESGSVTLTITSQ